VVLVAGAHRANELELVGEWEVLEERGIDLRIGCEDAVAAGGRGDGTIDIVARDLKWIGLIVAVLAIELAAHRQGHRAAERQIEELAADRPGDELLLVGARARLRYSSRSSTFPA